MTLLYPKVSVENIIRSKCLKIIYSHEFFITLIVIFFIVTSCHTQQYWYFTVLIITLTKKRFYKCLQYRNLTLHFNYEVFVFLSKYDKPKWRRPLCANISLLTFAFWSGLHTVPIGWFLACCVSEAWGKQCNFSKYLENCQKKQRNQIRTRGKQFSFAPATWVDRSNI